ncbi:MAG: hypothetical protein KA035_03115 [Candidatus Levybacteria bacterium]|nr:hypothetical protein [Candidatus Levybacteria bacterium]
MGKPIEIVGRKVQIGDRLTVNGQPRHVRGFYNNLPVAGVLSGSELEGARSVMRSLIPLLSDHDKLREIIEAGKVRRGTNDVFNVYEHVVRRLVIGSAKEHVAENKRKIATQLLEGVFFLQGSRKTSFKDSDFISEGKTDDGQLFLKRCPFSGVARMIAGATYKVVHEDKD